MHLDPQQAHTILPRVDPGRTRSGRAVGLRDGAILALVAAGLSTVQIAALRASDITQVHQRVIVLLRRGENPMFTQLPRLLGGRLIAWLSETKAWSLPEPLFRGCRGPLTPMGIWKIVDRYRKPQTRRRPLSRASKQSSNASREKAA